jgi:hypothetical protein
MTKPNRLGGLLPFFQCAKYSVRYQRQITSSQREKTSEQRQTLSGGYTRYQEGVSALDGGPAFPVDVFTRQAVTQLENFFHAN